MIKRATYIFSIFLLVVGFATFSAPKAEASFWDHFSIGIGFGNSYASYGGYDPYYGYDNYGYGNYGYGNSYDYYPTYGYYDGNYNSYGNNYSYYPSYQSYPTYNYPSYQSYGNYSPTMYSTPIAPTYGYYNGGCNNNYGCNSYSNLNWTH